MGCIRHLALLDGGWVREELVEMEPKKFTYTYIILESTMPITNYRACVTLAPEEVGKVKITWKGEFNANEGVNGNEFGEGVSENIYRVAVNGLIALLSS